jgi:hypothetical protein
MKAMESTLLRTIPVLAIASFISCGQGPKPDPLKALRTKAEKSICADVRGIGQTALDAASMGMGSMVVGLVLSESQQDSLLMGPMLPLVRAELKKCDKGTLEGITSRTSDRYRFIAKVLVNNRDKITASVKEKYEYAAPFVEMAVKHAEGMAGGTKDPS